MSPRPTNLALLTTRRITIGVIAAAVVGVGGVSLHLADAMAATQQSASGGTSGQSGDDGSSAADGSDGFAPVQAPLGQQAQGQQAQGQQGNSGGGTTTHGS
ncbi:hypothetical protein [Lapillicoccus sp.]|uniref:hypothetical protein n=1 Tax=Lapillicoccus sp. TaxID=1909287 RepID=UPI0025DAB995|nr:hypothetical protein [Lapillicoccus sp.]